MARSLEERLEFFDEDAPAYVPPSQENENFQGMAWRLIRVDDSHRSTSTVPAKAIRQTRTPLFVMVGTRQVTVYGGEKFELVALTTAGELVCEMSAAASRWERVKLTNGYVLVEQSQLRGLRLGSFCFNQVVCWAKTQCPDSEVETIQLRASDASGVNRHRRNAFYEKFGIRFDYSTVDGVENAAGESQAMKARELVSRAPADFPNIVEIDMPHLVGAATSWLPQSQQRASDLRQRIGALYQRCSPTHRFLRAIGYLNWLGYLAASLATAALMTSWPK